MDYQSMYLDYKRPPLSPPPYLFGIVWPVLYLLIIISYGYVFWRVVKGDQPLLFLWPFVLNLIANGLFTYFQFKLRNNGLALADIVVELVTIVLTIVFAWQQYRWVSYMQIPYLMWVLFATYLQVGVTILNR